MNKKKNSKETYFSFLTAGLCFSFIFSHTMFLDTYSREMLSLEFMSMFLCLVVFAIAFFKFLETGKTKIFIFSLMLFLSFFIGLLRNIVLPFTKPSEIISAHNSLIFSYLFEILILGIACVTPTMPTIKQQVQRVALSKMLLLYLSSSAIILCACGVLFFGLPAYFSSEAQQSIFATFAMISFGVVFVSVLLCGILALWSLFVHKIQELLWHCIALFFLLVALVFYYRAMWDEALITQAMVYRAGAYILLFVGAIHEFHQLFRENSSYAKMLEDDLSQQLKESEQKNEAYEVLREKTIETEETSRNKSELLANMSHELRTPMNAIIGFTARVIKKSGDMLPERQLKNLKTVQRNAHHLLGLINTILDVSKMEAGRMEVVQEEVDLGGLVDEIMEMGEALLQEKSVVLVKKMSEHIVIQSDRTKIKQMIVNLVGNAVKFTEQGEICIRVRQEATITKEGAGEDIPGISIAVQDSGIGIKKEELPTVFDDYKQVDSSLTRKTGGTGLGLALVKRFSHLLGGRVFVESEYQRGTTFTILLPLEPQKNIAVSETEKEKKVKEKIVLSCEPDVQKCEALMRYCENEGVKLIAAANKDEAFTKAKETHPRLVTIEILSPSVKGVDIVRKLRDNYYTKDIPLAGSGFFGLNNEYGYFFRIWGTVLKPTNKAYVNQLLDIFIRNSLPNKTVLIIDHDVASLEVLQKLFLQEEEYRILCAQNIHETVTILGQAIPDVIVVNLALPNLEGFRILGGIGTTKKICDVPVIFSFSPMSEQSVLSFYQSQEAFLPPEGELTQSDVLSRIIKNVQRGI